MIIDGTLEILYLCIAMIGYVVVAGLGVAAYQWMERIWSKA